MVALVESALTDCDDPVFVDVALSFAQAIEVGMVWEEEELAIGNLISALILVVQIQKGLDCSL